MSAFFFKLEKDVMMLHFATTTYDEENNKFHNWHCMPLKQDFIDQLQKHGRLPEPSVKAYFDEIAKNEELKTNYQMITEKLEEIKNQKAVTPEVEFL